MESDFFRGCWDKNMQVVPVEQPIRGEVMEKKVVVPEVMRLAAVNALLENFEPRERGAVECDVRIALTAACRALSENPIVPTTEQVREMFTHIPHEENSPFDDRCRKWYIAEWQRRCFLAPEPVVPEDDICEIGAVLRDRGVKVSNFEVGEILKSARK